MSRVGIPKVPATPSASRRNALPTKAGAVAFAAKAAIFRLRRTLGEVTRKAPRALPRETVAKNSAVVAESRSRLYTTALPAEWALQAGKVQNLRVAAHALNGAMLAPGATFSFWANVGRATRRRGYVKGRELREGCVIPNIGGGLCQLSNALYAAALQAGLEIVERHAHSRQVPGASFAGRDATVFWNYVDLRFRSKRALQIAVELTADELIVRLHAIASTSPVRRTGTVENLDPLRAESCETCGMADCFRHAEATSLPHSAGAAWVVDAFQPELDGWMRTNRTADDHLLLPLDSNRWRLGPYRWTSTGFAAVRQAPWVVARRSFASRRLANQGAARQRTLLEMDRTMALALGRRLPPLASHLTVSQNLLPVLWQEGLLGGRTFDVLMTRLPLFEIEAALDRAAKLHPESPTLADFRAPEELVEAERQALGAAQRWITPHRAIATSARERACVLDWKLPPAHAATRGDTIVFPASTIGRKGAYELRAAAREMKLGIRLCGPVLESTDFWSGIATSRAPDDWLQGAAVVVLPAWVEHHPRRLLQALAAGVPVIASEACGLSPSPGLITVPSGDVAALKAAMENVLAGAF